MRYIIIQFVIIIFITSCSMSKSDFAESSRADFQKCWSINSKEPNIFEANLLIYKYENKHFGFLDSTKCPIDNYLEDHNAKLDYNNKIAMFRMIDKTSNFNFSVDEGATSPHFSLYGEFKKKYSLKAIGKIKYDWFGSQYDGQGNRYYIVSVDKIISLDEIDLSEFEKNVFLSDGY